MDDEQIAVVKLTGHRVTIERYRCELVASSHLPASRERLREIVAASSPLVVVWPAADVSGRMLGREASQGAYRSADAHDRAARTPAWVELSEEAGSLPELLTALSAARPEAEQRSTARAADHARESRPAASPTARPRPTLGASLDRVLTARARRGIDPGQHG